MLARLKRSNNYLWNAVLDFFQSFLIESYLMR